MMLWIGESKVQIDYNATIRRYSIVDITKPEMLLLSAVCGNAGADIVRKGVSPDCIDLDVDGCVYLLLQVQDGYVLSG